MIGRIEQNETWKTLIIVLGLLFFSLTLNFWTPYVADDFSYMLSLKTGERITNIFQIFPSVWVNYTTITGRWVPHLLIQFMLMFPKWIFNVVNAVAYTILILLVMKVTGRNKRLNIFLCAGLVMLLWGYVASYGQVFLWICGSFNYMWPLLLSLVWILPYVDLYLDGKRIEGRGKWIGFCTFTFFFGAYSESVSFATIFIGFVMLLAAAVKKREYKSFFVYIVPIVVGAIGYLTMFLAPGERRYTSDISIGDAWDFLQYIYLEFYKNHAVLLILWAILLGVNILWKVRKEQIWMSVFFFAIGWICVTMLCVGSYLENRSLAAGTFFLLVAIMTLLQNLRGEKAISVGNLLPVIISCYFILVNLQALYDGAYDIYDTNRRVNARADYIRELVAEGETTFTVYKLHPNTSYPANYGLVDIPSESDGVPWMNRYIALYYGAEMIYAEWE